MQLDIVMQRHLWHAQTSFQPHVPSLLASIVLVALYNQPVKLRIHLVLLEFGACCL